MSDTTIAAVEFETERLIEEVSVRPPIWDLNSTEYHMQRERQTAWREICNVMFDNFESKSDANKFELQRLLQRRWKGLRDTYVREHHQNMKNKGHKVYRRKYLYFNVLSFLQPTVKKKYRKSTTKPDRDPLWEENDSIKSEERETSKSIKILKGFNKNSRNSELRSSSESEPVQHEQIPQDHSDDEDRLFLLSLVKDLKKIPENHKLAAKSELMLLLDKWKKTV